MRRAVPIEVQRGMAGQNADVPQDTRIEFRIGIHVGDIIIDDNDIFGDGVNIAARLKGIAEPGGVCISDDAQRQIRGKVDIAFDDMGVQTLKNIAEPMRAWRIQLGANAAKAPARFAGEAPTLALPDKPSIAVLPFQNMSGDPEQEYFADGMVEDIITALSRFKSLFVIARNSSFTYKGRPSTSSRSAANLVFATCSKGAFGKPRNRVRITGQLIDTATGAHLWADRFDGDLDDVFDLQDQVTASVVGVIAPAVEKGEIERATRKPTESLDTYALTSRFRQPESVCQPGSEHAALRLFNSAIDSDPDLRLPAAVPPLAAPITALGRLSDTATDCRSTRLVKRAVELDKDDAIVLAEVQGGLACAVRDSGGRPLINRALVLNPNLAEAWRRGGWVKNWLGEPRPAIERFARAIRLIRLIRARYYETGPRIHISS